MMVIIILYFDVGGVIIIGLGFWLIIFEELEVEDEDFGWVEISLVFRVFLWKEWLGNCGKLDWIVK